MKKESHYLEIVYLLLWCSIVFALISTSFMGNRVYLVYTVCLFALSISHLFVNKISILFDILFFVVPFYPLLTGKLCGLGILSLIEAHKVPFSGFGYFGYLLLTLFTLLVIYFSRKLYHLIYTGN
jgi:hypothetical protein